MFRYIYIVLQGVLTLYFAKVTQLLHLQLPVQFPSSQHTANTNTGITPTRLSTLYTRLPNKQLPCVIIIGVLQIVFYHSTKITSTFYYTNFIYL